MLAGDGLFDAARVRFGIGSSSDPFAQRANPVYLEEMAKSGRTDFEEPTSVDEEEDEETLAAIDEGIRDVEAGRAVPIAEVRKLLPQWITTSSAPKER